MATSKNAPHPSTLAGFARVPVATLWLLLLVTFSYSTSVRAELSAKLAPPKGMIEHASARYSREGITWAAGRVLTRGTHVLRAFRQVLKQNGRAQHLAKKQKQPPKREKQSEVSEVSESPGPELYGLASKLLTGVKGIREVKKHEDYDGDITRIDAVFDFETGGGNPLHSLPVTIDSSTDAGRRLLAEIADTYQAGRLALDAFGSGSLKQSRADMQKWLHDRFVYGDAPTNILYRDRDFAKSLVAEVQDAPTRQKLAVSQRLFADSHGSRKGLETTSFTGDSPGEVLLRIPMTVALNGVEVHGAKATVDVDLHPEVQNKAQRRMFSRMGRVWTEANTALRNLLEKERLADYELEKALQAE